MSPQDEKLKEESVKLRNVEEEKLKYSPNVLQKYFLDKPNDPGRILRVEGCQIRMRMNGEMEVYVPGDPERSKKLQNVFHSLYGVNMGSLLSSSSLNSLPNFKMAHLSSVEELERMELQLKNPVVRKKMRDNIEVRKYKGETGPDCMERNLTTLMTDDLAKKFSWAGKDGNRRFKDLNLTKFLIDVILDMDPSSTAYSLEKVIKLWSTGESGSTFTDPMFVQH